MDSQLCPNCGQPVDPAVADGLCLGCLGRLGTGAPPEPPPGLLTGNAPLAPGRILYFGDYELLEELGQGGMGVVYRARQISLNREVAVKLILLGPFASEDFLRRFRTEAETIGQFRHRNIVAIYETGEHEGQPYFAMEYVPGKTLADLVGSDALPPRDVARLMTAVARAVQYVHDRGVLHRDLKPTNVLLDELGEPRVADFGVAKRLAKEEEFTLTGQVLGAPAFMSPEQISARSGALTTRSDVYSLGAIIYFLLTGRPPIVADSLADTLKAVSEDEPPLLRQINPKIPPELETICLKCLAKESIRRYETAEELARDLDRWLAGKPILAKPVGLLGRQWLWIKRNPVVSTLCAVLALSVITGGAGVLREWRLSERNQIRADDSRREILATTVRVQAQKAEELFEQHKPHEALALLAANVRLDPANRVTVSRLRSALTSRSFVQPVMPPLDDNSSLFQARMSFDNSRIATGDMGRRMQLWDAKSGRSIGPPIEFPGTLADFIFSGNSHTLMTLGTSDAVCFWDAQLGGLLGRFPCGGTTEASDVSSNGFYGAVGMPNGEIVLFDRRRLGEERRWAAHAATINWIEFSRDGHFLASGADDHIAKVWDVFDEFKLLTSVDQSNAVVIATVSPNRDRLLTAGASDSPRIWEIPSGRPMAMLNGSNFLAAMCRFSPDGARVIIPTKNGPVLLFDAVTGRQLLQYDGHANQVMAVDFSPDGQRVASCGNDNTARIWEVHTGRTLTEPILHEDIGTVVQFDCSGQHLMTGSPVGGVRLWDVFPRAELPLRVRTGENIAAAAYSHDDTELWTISHTGAVCMWNAGTAALMRTIWEGGAARVDFAEFNEGLVAAVLVRGSNVSFLNLTNGVQVLAQVPAADDLQVLSNFSPDGRKVALATKDNVFVYDAGSGRLLLGPLHCTSPVGRFGHTIHCLRFSPDGGKIAAACQGVHACVWDAINGVVVADFPHQGPVLSVEFSPDGARLLTAAADNTARIWALTNSSVPLRVFHHHEFSRGAIFSDDGRRVLTGTYGGRAFLWDTVTGDQISLVMPYARWTYPVAFSPSGSEALTHSEDAVIRRWDTRTGLLLGEPYASGAGPFVISSPLWDSFAASAGLEDFLIWHETRPATPCPEWLPTLGEGIAGLRYTTNGTEQSVPAGEFLALKDKLLHSVDTDPWTKWGKWFLGDVPQRTYSWDSPVTVQAYIDSLLAGDRLDDLRQALLFAPTNGLVLARLARRTLDETNNPCCQVEADFLSRRALEFAPNSAEVAKLRIEISARLESH